MNSIHKIKSITFKNYRAFYGDYKKIELNGKNLLVWGENGSGKSSFCKSLQDFVLSINNDRHQKNIFSNDDWSIEFEIDNESSSVNFSSENIVDKDYIKNCATALPFLDYRKVLSLYFSPDSKDGELNLFEIFEKLLENFPVKSKDGKLLKDLKSDSGYKDIINDLLNNQLKDNIIEILKDFNLNFNLEGFVVEQDKIYIKTSVFGEQIEEKYHEFLNEARLSALSISVYFAAIKKLLNKQIDILNILVLDDMLIGLDMGNRMAIFDIIKKHFSNTQIFFFTYDKAWFETFRYKVNDKKQWIVLEMYAQSVKENGKTFEKPFIKEKDDLWMKAAKAMENFDYDNCGNLLRKELEKQLDKYLRLDKNNIDEKIRLANLQAYYDKNKAQISFDNKFDYLKEIKKIILNPYSHYSELFPFYKQELENAFDAIIKLMEENGETIDLENERRKINLNPEIPTSALTIEKTEISHKAIIETTTHKQDLYELDLKDLKTLENFNETTIQDLKNANLEKYLEDGYFELIMKPVENKQIFYSTGEIIDSFKPIKISFDDIFPVVGGLVYDQDDISKNYSIGNDERHSLYITQNWGYEIFSAFTNGFFILRKSYPKNRFFLDRSHVVFPDIVGFVTKSLMLAKQFYSERLGKDEKIYFEWRLAKTKDRELVPPNRNWRFGGICNINEIIEKRVYEYEELNEYIDNSREIIGEICKQFGWRNGITYVDEFNKDFIDSSNLIESSGIMDMGTATATVQVWHPNDPKNEEISKKIIELVKNDPNISAATIAEKAGIDAFVIQHVIEKMEGENKIRRIGPDKGGHWEIITEENEAK